MLKINILCLASLTMFLLIPTTPIAAGVAAFYLSSSWGMLATIGAFAVALVISFFSMSYIRSLQEYFLAKAEDEAEKIGIIFPE